jgi:hypothetical protein
MALVSGRDISENVGWAQNGAVWSSTRYRAPPERCGFPQARYSVLHDLNAGARAHLPQPKFAQGTWKPRRVVGLSSGIRFMRDIMKMEGLVHSIPEQATIFKIY